MRKKVYKEILSWLLFIGLGLGVAVLFNKVIIYKVQPTSESMENTIMVGETVITNRLAYLISEPKRGDIVVFKYPDNEEEDYIKRIIGLPGQTVEGKKADGLVYIDGVAIDEPYVMDPIEEDFGPFLVPEDSYFMMGDNRSISFDSRYWINSYVHKDKIYGKALFKYPKFKWLG